MYAHAINFSPWIFLFTYHCQLLYVAYIKIYHPLNWIPDKFKFSKDWNFQLLKVSFVCSLYICYLIHSKTRSRQESPWGNRKKGSLDIMGFTHGCLWISKIKLIRSCARTSTSIPAKKNRCDWTRKAIQILQEDVTKQERPYRSLHESQCESHKKTHTDHTKIVFKDHIKKVNKAKIT